MWPYSLASVRPADRIRGISSTLTTWDELDEEGVDPDHLERILASLDIHPMLQGVVETLEMEEKYGRFPRIRFKGTAKQLPNPLYVPTGPLDPRYKVKV